MYACSYTAEPLCNEPWIQWTPWFTYATNINLRMYTYYSNVNEPRCSEHLDIVNLFSGSEGACYSEVWLYLQTNPLTLALNIDIYLCTYIRTYVVCTYVSVYYYVNWPCSNVFWLAWFLFVQGRTTGTQGQERDLASLMKWKKALVSGSVDSVRHKWVWSSVVLLSQISFLICKSKVRIGGCGLV